MQKIQQKSWYEEIIPAKMAEESADEEKVVEFLEDDIVFNRRAFVALRLLGE